MAALGAARNSLSHRPVGGVSLYFDIFHHLLSDVFYGACDSAAPLDSVKRKFNRRNTRRDCAECIDTILFTRVHLKCSDKPSVSEFSA